VGLERLRLRGSEVNWWPFSKPKPKQLRFRLLIGGRLMWDISEAELRETLAFNGGIINETAQTKFPHAVIEFIVTEYP
jgi:hypothetical protein